MVSLPIGGIRFRPIQLSSWLISPNVPRSPPHHRTSPPVNWPSCADYRFGNRSLAYQGRYLSVRATDLHHRHPCFAADAGQALGGPSGLSVRGGDLAQSLAVFSSTRPMQALSVAWSAPAFRPRDGRTLSRQRLLSADSGYTSYVLCGGGSWGCLAWRPFHFWDRADDSSRRPAFGFGLPRVLPFKLTMAPVSGSWNPDYPPLNRQRSGSTGLVAVHTAAPACDNALHAACGRQSRVE